MVEQIIQKMQSEHKEYTIADCLQHLLWMKTATVCMINQARAALANWVFCCSETLPKKETSWIAGAKLPLETKRA